jgi:hypothetical protein
LQPVDLEGIELLRGFLPPATAHRDLVSALLTKLLQVQIQLRPLEFDLRDEVP